MPNRDIVLDLLRRRAGLTDGEIEELTGIHPHQQVNQLCRRLESEGLLHRRLRTDGLIGNWPSEEATGTATNIPNFQVAPSRSLPPKPEFPQLVNRMPSGNQLEGLNIGNTLVVIPCSGSKLSGGASTYHNGPSVLDSLPKALASELQTARKNIRQRANVNETFQLPALQRYTGHLYEGAVAALKDLVREEHLLIISGGYGLLVAEESIGYYNAVFHRAWWPKGLIEECIASYTEKASLKTAVGFLASTTDYAKVFRKVPWRAHGITRAYLVSPAFQGGGAQVLVPRCLGEALAAFLLDNLTAHWRSSDGLTVNVEQVA